MAGEQLPGGQDEDMDVIGNWDAGIEGQELDSDFRNAECLEVEFDEDDEAPDDDDDDLPDADDEEIGVIGENEIYSDDDTPQVDDSLAKVTHQNSVLTCALSPTDRRVLLTGGQDDVAVLWTIEEKADGGLKCSERCRLTGHTDSVVQVAFSNDGAFAATGSYDGTVRIWNVSDGSLVQTLEGPSKEIEWILWHPKGLAILAGSTDTMAWMWWAPSGKLMQIFAGHAASVSCGCWGLGGKVVITGSEDKSVIVWNPRAGSPQQTIREVHESPIISICSHPESPIVVTGAEDATAKVIQIETGKVIAPLPGHVDSVEVVAFSNAPSGGHLLLATGGMDGKVMIWDGKTMEPRCTLKDHEEKGGIVKAKWLPGPVYGNWLCTCSTDKTLRLFNALAGHCIRTLQGHSDTVLDMDLSLGEVGGGPQLVVTSAAEDKSCLVFVVSLWTAGKVEGQASSAVAGQSAGGYPSTGGYGAGAPPTGPVMLPSPALQATGALVPPPDSSPAASTPSASPGVPKDGDLADKNLPV